MEFLFLNYILLVGTLYNVVITYVTRGTEVSKLMTLPMVVINESTEKSSTS